MTIKIENKDAPTDDDRHAILEVLRAYNRAQTDPDPFGSFAVLLKNPDAGGEVIGGLWATYGFDWMFVELLVVPESARGQGLGRSLMAAAEEKARALGLHGIWLDTFSFQAPEFYQKLGYEIFGKIEHYPAKHDRYYLKKQL